MKKYGIGLIGVGMGSALLAVNAMSDSKLEVRGVCAGHFEKALHVKESYRLRYAVNDFRDLLNKPDIDIIAVYSPDHLHGAHCIAALEAGKHVICTKPLVTSLQDAKRITGLVRQRGVKFLVGQTMRYEPQFVTVKSLYDEGDLGEIIMAEAHYVHDMRPVFEVTPWRLEAPQDLMYGGVSHPVDVLRWFLGDVDEVFAYGDRGDLTPAYPLKNNFLLNLKFKNGVIARVLGAYGIVHPPMPMMGITIFGAKGTASGSFTDKLGGRVSVVLDKLPYKAEGTFLYPPETEGAYGHGETVIRYLTHFERCLENDETPVPDATEGAKSIAVCAAAWESIHTGRPVKVFNDF